MIIYKKGNVFSESRNSMILVHACNCVGSWGAGIATCFREKFPRAYMEYRAKCLSEGPTLIGTSIILKEDEWFGLPLVGCLFTSVHYGYKKDTVDVILKNTDKAIESLFSQIGTGNWEIHSPMINAGLFGVPWEKTAEIIEKHLATRPDLTWTVWQL